MFGIWVRGLEPKLSRVLGIGFGGVVRNKGVYRVRFEGSRIWG